MNTNPSGVSPETPIDVEQLLERCLGNIDFAQRIITKFQSSFDKEIQELEQCVKQRDSDRAAMTAHRMKGASANVAADSLRGAVEKIEFHARAGRLDEVPSCLQELRAAWGCFQEYAANVHSHCGANAE